MPTPTELGYDLTAALGVPAANPTPEEVRAAAADLRDCADAWEPGARLLGNVTARSISEVCTATLAGLDAQRDLARYKKAVAERLHWDARSLITASPEAEALQAQRDLAELWPLLLEWRHGARGDSSATLYGTEERLRGEVDRIAARRAVATGGV